MECSPATRRALLIAVALVLALAPGIACAEPVVDTDGHPLKSGEKYRISPVTGGGIGLRPRNESCPMYVYYAKVGGAVVFTPFSGEALINESSDVKVEMAVSSSACAHSTQWRLTTHSDVNKTFVYAGDAERSSQSYDYFRIEKSSTEGDGANVYEMWHCPCARCRLLCERVVTYSDGEGTGFLVLVPNSVDHFRLQFKKA